MGIIILFICYWAFFEYVCFLPANHHSTNMLYSSVTVPKVWNMPNWLALCHSLGS